jgi:hypothetical protein
MDKIEKLCTVCNHIKDISFFSNDKYKKDGKRPECKSCKANRDKKYKEANINKIKQNSVEYYNNNKETIKQRVKIWCEENKEKSKETKAKYYQDNKEKIDLAKKEWHEKNKDKMKIWINTYMKNRYHSNFDYRIKSIMNKRIRDYIRLKTKPTLEFLGCSIEDFKKWIEYQFNEHMNWDNMGSYWSFDHVKPCNSFDFSDQQQILDCYNWTNLRPLKAIENSSKGSKIDNIIIEQHKKMLELYIKEK